MINLFNDALLRVSSLCFGQLHHFAKLIFGKRLCRSFAPFRLGERKLWLRNFFLHRNVYYSFSWLSKIVCFWRTIQMKKLIRCKCRLALQLHSFLQLFILNRLVFCQEGQEVDLFIAFFGLAEARGTRNSVKSYLDLSLACFIPVAGSHTFIRY